MKHLNSIILAAALFFGLAASPATRAADLYLTGTAAANVSSNIVATGGLLIADINWINTSTNTALIKFYDTTANTNTIVRPAFTSYTRYTTNWVNVFTNAAGIVSTNTFSGTYYAPVSNAAVTNERPIMVTFQVPASGTFNLTDINSEIAHGLTVLPTQAGQYVITYRKTSP